MARGNTWVNDDGLIVGFQTLDSFNVEDAGVHTLGHVAQAEVRFNFDNAALLVADVVPTGKEFELPAGSAVVGGAIVVGDVDFDVTTSIELGLRDATTGATVTSDALLLAASAQAADVTAGSVLALDGTIVGLDVTAVDTILELTQVGGDATAGEITVLIEYVVPHVSQAAPAVIVGEI